MANSQEILKALGIQYTQTVFNETLLKSKYITIDVQANLEIQKSGQNTNKFLEFQDNKFIGYENVYKNILVELGKQDGNYFVTTLYELVDYKDVSFYVGSNITSDGNLQIEFEFEITLENSTNSEGYVKEIFSNQILTITINKATLENSLDNMKKLINNILEDIKGIENVNNSAIDEIVILGIIGASIFFIPEEIVGILVAIFTETIEEIYEYFQSLMLSQNQNLVSKFLGYYISAYK